MRIGFTIIYNGKHHLEHYCELLPQMLDYWVIVEGAADPGGSTSWCKPLESKMSTDGTIELLEDIEYRHENVSVVFGKRSGWKSKDEMVNAAISKIKNALEGMNYDHIFLWQIDIDEVWKKSQMDDAEKELIELGGDCGCFHANHFVGTNIVARGTWGEGNDPKDPLKNAYRRLWKWSGQLFGTHEPPALEGGNGKEFLLPQRFNHYSYLFEKDVVFKSQYYQGYEDLHEKWLSLQKETVFPQPVSRLIGGGWGKTESVIDLL